MTTPFGHGGTNIPPSGSKCFSEFFSSSHIKLTYNNPNKDSKSVEGLKEVEKIKLDSKIFSSLKIKKKELGGIRTCNLLLIACYHIH